MDLVGKLGQIRAGSGEAKSLRGCQGHFKSGREHRLNGIENDGRQLKLPLRRNKTLPEMELHGACAVASRLAHRIGETATAGSDFISAPRENPFIWTLSSEIDKN
jgi:hypothetical protein